MGRLSCGGGGGGGVQPKLRKGLWSPEEDEKLYNHIIRHGVGCWSTVPKLAGKQSCNSHCCIHQSVVSWSSSHTDMGSAAHIHPAPSLPELSCGGVQGCSAAARAAACGGSTTSAPTSSAAASRSRRRTSSSRSTRSWGTGGYGDSRGNAFRSSNSSLE
jgi:hypothetical protein